MSVVRVSFFSEALMRTVNFMAILPMDKKAPDGHVIREKGKKFKTLYLLHGIHGNEYDWITGTRVKRWAMERDLVVIMPSGENKFYQDHEQSGDRFARFVGEELVGFTRDMFPLSEKKEDTFVAGLSMGGLGAIYTGFRYPENFSCIGGFSTAFVGPDYPKDSNSLLLLKKKNYHEAMFGPEEEYEGSGYDYKNLIRQHLKKGGEMPKMYLSCGYSDSLLESNRDFVKFLQINEIAADYYEDEGNHEWDFWDRHLYRFLNWLPLA